MFSQENKTGFGYSESVIAGIDRMNIRIIEKKRACMTANEELNELKGFFEWNTVK